MIRFASASIALVLACVGCSSSNGSEGGEADKGAAPTVSDFKLGPAGVNVGTPQLLMGSINLADADGDLSVLVNQVVPPDGSTQPTSETSLAPLGDKKEATVPMQLSMPALPKAGAYQVMVWARDKAGNESAKATVTITAK